MPQARRCRARSVRSARCLGAPASSRCCGTPSQPRDQPFSSFDQLSGLGSPHRTSGGHAMTAWAEVEDESRSIPEPPDPAPQRSAHAWVKPALISLAVAVAAFIFLFVLPSAFADPSGGCGGG